MFCQTEESNIFTEKLKEISEAPLSQAILFEGQRAKKGISAKIFCEPKSFLVTKIPRYTIISRPAVHIVNYTIVQQ